MPILIGADVGGSKTAVGVSEGANVLARADGPGAAVRPNRALASAGMIAEVVRRALANLGRLSGDVLLVGAAGAGRDPERSELVKARRSRSVTKRAVPSMVLSAILPEKPSVTITSASPRPSRSASIKPSKRMWR